MITADKLLAGQIGDWISDTALELTWADRAESPLENIDNSIALLLLDARFIGSADLHRLMTLRSLDPFRSPLPALPFGKRSSPVGQALEDWCLDRNAFRSQISWWVGPLDDTTFRSLADPYYRLMRMSGKGHADFLFHIFLRELREYASGTHRGHVQEAAHKLAGSAGLMGYEALSYACSAVERQEPDARAKALTATRALIATIEKLPLN